MQPPPTNQEKPDPTLQQFMNRSIEHEGYADDGGGFFMTQNEFNPRDG